MIELVWKLYSDMQKIFLLLIPLLLWGCEKSFDNILDIPQSNYQIISVAGIKDSLDLKNPEDSLLTVRILLKAGSVIQSASFDVLDPDNSRLNSSQVPLLALGANVYQNNFLMQQQFLNGNYIVNIYVEDATGNNQLAAIAGFNFNNGQDNIAPVIANTIVDPDTAVVTQRTVILTSVEASDSNGTNDIDEVYFIVYKPDGSTNGNKILLFDDGRIIENGDVTPDDGIYSRLIEVDETNDKGTYRFEFQAIDRSGASSNIINHFVLIQ